MNVHEKNKKYGQHRISKNSGTKNYDGNSNNFLNNPNKDAHMNDGENKDTIFTSLFQK